MSNAAEQARSTRSDAQAFADAFSGADDAFTFGPDAGESRTMTLDELGDVLSLNGPVALPAPRDLRVVPASPAALADDGDELLTLDELGDALARPSRPADVLDFDFGTSAHERARRRTAARLDAAPGARRRLSGPSSTRGRRGAEEPDGVMRPPARAQHAPDTSAEARAAIADASASAAERMAAPRFARDRSTIRLEAAQALPAQLRPSDDFLADPDARRTVAITGRPGEAAPRARGREVERRQRTSRGPVERLTANPDRIAMWAVLLGILLVLIAFTSGSGA